MRNFKKFWPARSRTVCSLLIVAGVLLLTAALAPKANATVLLYFNFEDVAPNIGTYDHDADIIPPLGDNPGGGVQAAFIQDSFVGPGTVGTAVGTPNNRTPLDIDTSTLRSLGLRTTVLDNGSFIQIRSPTPGVGFNASSWSNMSLSFACNTQGNGFNSVTLSYSITPGHAAGTFVNFATQALPTGGGFNVFTLVVPVAVDHQSDVIIRMTFTGGTSNGNNLETFIDNIRLDGVVPEPTTIAGGLLGVLGLCWHQRRRLIRSVRFQRT